MTDTAPEARPVVCDVICAATVTDSVRRHLLALAKAPLGHRGEFALVYHLTTDNPAVLPAGLAMYDRGPLSSPAYAAAATKARIVIDLNDGAETDRAARLAVLKQARATILAEDSPAARAALPPEALFTTPETLVDKVYGHLR
jgi:hypothetical protein